LAELNASTAKEAKETQDLLPSEGGEARRSLRVAADQLDRLMRLAGELVITRARLAARVSALNLAQSELATSRARLVATVEGFRARNEFVGLAGDRGRTALAPAPLAGNRTEELFTDLELDRYEDIHVLARSLTEITGDMGELQGQIQRAIGDIGEDADRLGRAVGGIQSEITRARMVPLQPLFARLHLAVQDAAARAKLSLHVDLHGGGTTLDGSIVEGLHGPLTHLVRNAVAHGIEELDARRLAGKPPLGRITIAARQLGGQIVLTVADDGRGLDLAALHRKGVAMGLIEPVQPIDSEVVRNLVFASGLSTADGVDAVSGRGLGCDAARDGIVRLGGTLTVASEPGNGTVFTITLPLTLAITRALLVKAGDDLLAVPMNFIERILDLEHERLSQVAGQRRLAHGDGEIRLLDLAAALGQREQLPPAVGAALLVRLGEQRFAVQVDGLLRQEDVVVSGLGDLLTGHPLFAGVTLIAGTGGTGLVPIVDLPGLLAGTGGRHSLRQVGANRGARPSTAAARLHRVLFVDDSLSVRKVAEQHLRTLGVEPVLAVDGEDALSKLREGPIGMIFTDLEMPRMHGYDLLRELRFLPAFRALPVVVVTSRSGDKHRQLAEQLGANGYLPKPFTPDQLRDALERWLPGTASEGQRGAGKP
jgi:chemosensory pili system protein ChpA (sensor histidine kinase/response regulator)